MANKENSSAPEAGKSRESNFLEAKEIKRLLGILSQAGALELEIVHGDRRLKIRMPEPHSRTEYVQVPGAYPVPSFMGAPQPVDPQSSSPDGSEARQSAESVLPADAIHFKSPMVGTFYRASSPDADPFVQVGDKVKAEQTLCIIEAMKVMNDIKAEQPAEILQILVENEEPVEFGQPLMILRPH